MITTIRKIAWGFFGVLLFLAPALPSFAISDIKEGAILSLEDCINISINNNPNVQISKNNVKLTQSRVSKARADYFPSFGASTGFFGNNVNQDNESGHNYYYTAGISLHQLIYNFGKTNASIKMQQFNRISAEFDLDYTILQTTYNVKSAYYGVLASKAKLDIAKSNLEINKRQYTQIKAFFEEGIKSKIDFVNAEVNLSNSKIDLITAQTDYESALVKLNNSMYTVHAPNYSIRNTESFNFEKDWTDVKFLQIGDYKKLAEEVNSSEPVNYNKTLSTKIEKDDILSNWKFIPFDITFEEALDFARDKRPDFKSYIATKEAMEESLKYAKRQYMPDLTANAGYNYKNTEYLVSNGFNYSASLDFGSVNPMKTKFQVDEAQAQLDIAKENINLIEKNIFFEIQDAYVKLVQLEKQIPLYQKRIYSALENFKLADGRYGMGLSSFIELQDARSQYLNSEVEFVQTVYNYNIQKAKLETAMGEL